MHAPLHITTKVLPGRRIEIASPQFKEGDVVDVTVAPAAQAQAEEQSRPIWEVAAEIGAAVSPEDWARVPPDLSKHVDHYLYGAPRERE